MKTSLIEMQEYLDVVRIPVRIACKTTTDWPTVISLWFLHQDGLLYCATQKSAKIVNYLRNDARCAFEIAEDQPPYCGIRGQANARIDETRVQRFSRSCCFDILGIRTTILHRNC